MRQTLDTDTVSRFIPAPPELVYDIIADVTRTPELSDEVVRCEWIDGATGPAVGARFKAVNSAGRGPNWSNKPVVIAADRGREFAFSRTEVIGGTVEWRYQFTAQNGGTQVTESYQVNKPLPFLGWLLIGGIYGLKDRRSDLQHGMNKSLERLATIAEKEAARHQTRD